MNYSSAYITIDGYTPAYQDNPMLCHRSSNDEWIMTKRISVLDFCQVSLLPTYESWIAYGHQLLQYLIISSSRCEG